MLKNKINEQLLDCFENVQVRDYQESVELPYILAGICCEEFFKNNVNLVRQGSEKKEDVLPAFIPSLFNGKPTGIVQLDYDTIKNIENSEKLKRKLEANVPSLIYAFTSPSGGLKAAILTDFYGDGIEIEKFRFVVEVVEDEVRRLIGDPNIQFDPASKTLNQPCFFSYDENLVFNSEAVELSVISRAEELFLKRQEDQKSRVASIRHIHTIDNEEVRSAFQSIPTDSGKTIKNIINTAVLNVFGQDGIEMIMNHWIFKDEKKARAGLNKLYQKTLHDRTNKIGIRTIIEEAKRHGWQNTTWSGRKTTGLEGREPTYPCKLFPNVDDAVKRVQELIDNYFRHGIDTLIHAECGIGKTHLVLEKIAEINDTVAIFIPEHETAEEIKQKLIKLGVASDKFIVIQGYSRTCKRLMHLEEEEKIGLFQNWKTCLSCNHFHEKCFYHEQFKGDQRIRIYPQAYLYNPASSDRFKPAFVVVDESITENICDITHYKRNCGNIFKNLIDNEEISVDEIDAEITKLNKLFPTQNDGAVIPPPVYKFDSEKWKEELQKKRRNISVYNKRNHLEELKKKIEGKYTDYMIWNNGGRVYFGKKKRINARWHSKPILHLDASGDRMITEIVFEKDFKVYEKIRCEYADGVRVIQIFDKLFSKGQCAEEKTLSDLKWLVSMLQGNDNIGYVSYKQIDKKPFITNLISDHNRLLSFGGLRGKNKIEDAGCDTLLSIGRYMLADDALTNIAHVLFQADDFVKSTATVKKTYRMKDGNHLSANFVEYADERLQVLAEVFDKSETYQAGHRCRLLHHSNRTLILQTNEVLDFTIDELISVDQIIPASDKRRKLIKAIKKYDGDIPFKKNKIIMEKTGLSEEQIKNMKKDKEWIQHNFWFYVDDNEMFRFSPANNMANGHIPEQ